MHRRMYRAGVAGMVVLLVAASFVVGSAVAGRAPSSAAATQEVSARDNFFSPQEITIDPGDSIAWTNRGLRVHNITADDGSFASGNLSSGSGFTTTFPKDAYVPYFCSIHGARGGRGMHGVVIVGDGKPPDKNEGKARPRIVVPRDYKTIQRAVDAAEPKSVIIIRPGTYRESVFVDTPRLTIKGDDRYRTVLNGDDSRGYGFRIDGVNNVTIKNLTVRNYNTSGIYFKDVDGYKVKKVDSIKNRTYGIYAFDSYNGTIKRSFGWGSGDAAFYVGQCLACGALIKNVTARYNFIGYSGTNATGVVVQGSTFRQNGVGVVPNTLPFEELGPNRGTLVVNNVISNNNYRTVPAAGVSEVLNIPFGTGVWLSGVVNNEVLNNVISRHDSYGVLIAQSIDGDTDPANNRVIANIISDSDRDADGYGFDLAWDGSGSDNCFERNVFSGATGPPDIESTYSCVNRPFVGTAYQPVADHVVASYEGAESRPQQEPPEPRRPRCQKGSRGCDR